SLPAMPWACQEVVALRHHRILCRQNTATASSGPHESISLPYSGALEIRDLAQQQGRQRLLSLTPRLRLRRELISADIRVDSYHLTESLPLRSPQRTSIIDRVFPQRSINRR